MTTIERLRRDERMSQIVIHGDTIYLAGQTATDPVPSVAEQTRQILDKIDQYLSEAGTDKSKILLANIWLTDVSTFEEMNAVWDAWVAKGNSPARATVGSPLARPKNLVEIAVIAAR